MISDERLHAASDARDGALLRVQLSDLSPAEVAAPIKDS